MTILDNDDCLDILGVFADDLDLTLVDAQLEGHQDLLLVQK